MSSPGLPEGFSITITSLAGVQDYYTISGSVVLSAYELTSGGIFGYRISWLGPGGVVVNDSATDGSPFMDVSPFTVSNPWVSGERFNPGWVLGESIAISWLWS